MVFYIIYAVVLTLFSLYSYVLLDPNITFFNHPLWTAFRDAAVQIGYYQRPLSWWMYFSLILSLFALHLWSMKQAKRLNPIKLALLIGGILLFSYPFLSHDFFNYMFDAKILTFYHQNPYTHAALDFPSDPWLRFMHWVHRAYPYGPVFLAISLVPSFLGMGKFIIHYFLLKAMFTAFYVLTVYYMSKFKKEWGVFIATTPLILIEALNSSHNEIVALVLGVAGLYLLHKKDQVTSRVLFVASAGIKFMSFPYVFVSNTSYRWMNTFSFVAMIAVLSYAAFAIEVQPWYFLNLLFFLPIFPFIITRLQFFFLGLALCYYPFIAIGNWEIQYKHHFIIAGLVLNLCYFGWVVWKKKISLRSLINEAWSGGAHI